MNKELRIYMKVDDLFGEAKKHVVQCKTLSGYPKKNIEEDFTEDAIQQWTMDDGLVLEICNWHEADIEVIDVSVNKNDFDKLYNFSFEKYVKDKGFYTESVNVKGINYYYSFLGEALDEYRMQYYINE